MLPKCIDVVAILNFQPYKIWRELQSRNKGHTCEPHLEAGRQHAFDLDLEAERPRLLFQILRQVDTGL